QQLGTLQDGAVELQRVVLVTGGENRDWHSGEGRAVLSGDDLGHGLLMRQCHGVQQSLGEPVAHCRVQRAPVPAQRVELLSERSETRKTAALKQRGDVAAQIIKMLLAAKGRIATGNTRKDHVGAIAKGDLAVLELEHHRDDGRRLDDTLKAWSERLAVEQESI